MNVNLGIWSKLTKLVLILMGAAGLLAVGVWYLPLIRQNERMRQRVFQLDEQVKKEEELNKSLTTSVTAGRTDPKTVERLARETLGFAKPGETVIHFEKPPKPAPPR
ncbi:MAG: septum formation initiator family protein [Pedosphaera sp.]|nr:septum formation initiator family protein [Pedosphaera sp.]